MANKLTDMSKIRKAIKLHCSGKSKLFISQYLSLSRNTVKKYISLFEVQGLTIEEINQKTDLELETLFSHPPEESISPRLQKLYEFFPHMERELKRVGVTGQCMWEEYIKKYPGGYQSSQFREHYKLWSQKVNPVMHMNHKAGDKMFVDYAGKKLSVVEKDTGEVSEVEFFVAVLGASQYTYAEATASQKKEDFVVSVENAMRFFEGVPAAIVPDNLKSAVIKSSRFEPTINETLADLAEHYETTILPARAYKPRDKSLVEGAVKILYRRIYAALKDETFFSLAELNDRIGDLLDAHNNKKLTGRPYTRFELYNDIEKGKLSPLPIQRFEIKYQAQATVMQNGHVQLSCDKHFYSVPYQYIRKKVKVMYTRTTVEIYFKYNRLATHPRDYALYSYTTTPEHLASTHQFVTDWTAPRFINWANSIDPVAGEYIFKIIESRNHPEQAFKSCMGILSFEKKVGKQRLINACKRALDFGTYSFKAIQNILENNLDMIKDETTEDPELPEHNNIRGKNYYK
ncbi:mobile element protein [Aquipluma nitroreducens]|uniref:Mobile element protein n=2 Tax=Aquipluma nitroreducens TaxID=2010828 RepID=A0A5K7SAY7_9BACT|nr:mobile element protein [Aquipluma nitroreducens]BBE20367.1 mobile element protein [Aquipluma nitroreducens]